MGNLVAGCFTFCPNTHENTCIEIPSETAGNRTKRTFLPSNEKFLWNIHNLSPSAEQGSSTNSPVQFCACRHDLMLKVSVFHDPGNEKEGSLPPPSFRFNTMFSFAIDICPSAYAAHISPLTSGEAVVTASF